MGCGRWAGLGWIRLTEPLLLVADFSPLASGLAHGGDGGVRGRSGVAEEGKGGKGASRRSILRLAMGRSG